MRYIRTSNNYCEFIEADGNGQVLSSRGFQFGELYFQIKNGKVTFYLNDQENPWRNDVWTINIPFEIDGVEYDNEDDASAALHNIMNDRFQEQLDELREDLATETQRAIGEEQRIEGKLDDEIARSVSADTRHDQEISALHAEDARLNQALLDEISRATTNEDRIEDKLDDEIARSVSADTRHDQEIAAETAARISGDTYLEGLINAEVARATTAESALTNALNSETQRAISAETEIANDLDQEIADRQADVDAEETRALAAESALTNALNAEISRSTAKDAEHDALISGLTSSIDAEIARAISAETILHNEILDERNRALAAESGITENLDAEIQNRIADVDAEEARAISAETVLHNEILDERNRALAAESGLTNSLNAEITRSTAKDTEHDALISGLTNSLNNEITRASNIEAGLRSDLNTEISARTSADSAMIERIVALEVGKADANNVYTKAESDAKYATKEYISGLTEDIYTKDETDALLNNKADKANAVASAQYNSQNKTIDLKNISGTVISTIDARDFIKDGMVDNVVVSGGNLVITFNTDAGKEPISIPLTDIFNPNNYYTKNEIDNIVSGINEDISTISGDSYTKTEINGLLNNKADLSAFTAHTADTSIHFTTGDVQSQISSYTYDKATIDEKVASGGTFDPTQYYTKTEVDASQLIQDNKIDAISGDVITLSGDIITISGDSYTKTEVDSKLGNKADLSAFTAHTADTSIHFTTGDVQSQINDSMSSYTYDKQTIDNKIAQGGTFDPTQYYTTANTYSKTEVNGLLGDKADLSALTSHTADTSIHFTTGDVQSMITAATSGLQPTLSAGTNVQIQNNVISATDTTYSAGDNISISNQNVISTVTKFWCGTQAEYDAITTKDSNTVYMIHE